MKRIPWILGAASAVLVGCPAPVDQDDETPQLLPISAQSANLTATTNIHAHLTELAAVLKAFEGSQLVGEIFPKRDSAEPPPCEPGAPCEGTEGESDLDISDEAEDLEKWLKDNIFTAANVESETATSVTYRLKPEVACPEREDENGALARDADCVKLFTELAFRYVATSVAAGDLDLAVSITSQSGTAANPASFELKAARVAVAADLAEIRKAVDLIAGVQGEEIEDFPSTFQGKLKLAMTRDADRGYTFGLSVLDAVRVGNRVDTHPEYFFLDVSAGTNVVSGTLDGVQKTVVGGVDFKPVDLKIALDLIAHESGEETCTPNPDPMLPPLCTTVEKPAKTGVIAAHLGGASFKTNFTAVTDLLKVTDIGLGNETSTVKYNGTQILAFDLNKDTGRRFSFEARHQDRLTNVTVTPGFAARLAHDLNAIKDQLEDVPEWALKGVAEVRLEGTAPAIELEEGEGSSSAPCEPGGECPEPVEGDKGHFKVTSGKLVFSADGVTPVTVEAPMCVVEASVEGDNHPFKEIASGACE